jgi:hypothetical protein
VGQLYPWFAVTGQLIFGKELVGYVSTKQLHGVPGVQMYFILENLRKKGDNISVDWSKKNPTSLILSRALWLAEQIQPPLFF